MKFSQYRKRKAEKKISSFERRLAYKSIAQAVGTLSVAQTCLNLEQRRKEMEKLVTKQRKLLPFAVYLESERSDSRKVIMSQNVSPSQVRMTHSSSRTRTRL